MGTYSTTHVRPSHPWTATLACPSNLAAGAPASLRTCEPANLRACEPAPLLLRAARRRAAMSTMITFAANNEFFRKRKRNAPPRLFCAAPVANVLHRRPPRMRRVQETTGKQPLLSVAPL
jgi:hypothetical protein